MREHARLRYLRLTTFRQVVCLDGVLGCLDSMIENPGPLLHHSLHCSMSVCHRDHVMWDVIRSHHVYLSVGSYLPNLCVCARCEELGQQLAVVSSKADFLAVLEAVSGLTNTFSAWIGGRQLPDTGSTYLQSG